MSILQEVLEVAGKIEVEQINAKTSELTLAVSVCKEEVFQFLENVYIKFMQRPAHNAALSRKLTQTQDEVICLKNQLVQNRITDLAKTKNTLDTHLEDLDATVHSISIVRIFYNVHEALQELSDLQKDQNFVDCIEKIKETDDYLKSIDIQETEPLLNELSSNLVIMKHEVLNDLSEEFQNHLILTELEDGKSSLRIKNNGKLESVLKALYSFKNDVNQLDQVTKFFWNFIFVPIVDSTIEVEIAEDDGFIELRVVKTGDVKMNYVQVFENIRKVLDFLSENFKIQLDDELNTLEYIGRDIRDNLSELIIKRCLEDTIPSDEAGLKRYAEVIENVDRLEKSLISAEIFAKDTTSILEYANNFDILFINKKCQNYVVQAQNLMKEDLHDVVQVGELHEHTFEPQTSFPRSSISKSVLTILKLAEDVLIECLEASDVCAGRLFCTVQNILQMYSICVPEFHQKLLQTIPQQVAVFYNNCAYISYVLIKWNEKYVARLSSVLGVGPDGFAVERRQLEMVSSQMFFQFVDNQVKQMDDFLKGCDFQQGQTLDQVPASAEKCLRQCLRQQELLKTVWQKVLPYDTYNQTLGTILNSLCDRLVSVIVQFEDISSEAAEQLVELLKMLTTRGGKLFTDPKEVSLFVKSWYKVNELIFVLNASLFDINDRWADGKGPLAHHFKSAEIKQLIRALFQNTERRAALLNKIHN